MGSDNPIAETTRRILRDLADPQPSTGRRRRLEGPCLGRAGGGGADARLGARGAGRRRRRSRRRLCRAARGRALRAAVPLAETLLAGWLLARAGIALPKGAMTCAPARDGDRVTLAANGTLSGRAARGAVRQGRQAPRRARTPRRRRLAVALVEASQAAHRRRHEHRRRSAQRRALRRRAARCRQGCAGRPRRAGAAADGRRRARHADGGRARGHPRSLGRLRQRARRLRAPDRQVPGRAAQPRPPRRRDGGRRRRRRLRRRRDRHGPPPPWGRGRGGGSRTRTHSDEAVFLEAASAKIRVGEAATRGRRRSPTRCSAPSASPRSTRCTASRGGCGPGATTSATRASGR